MLTLKEPVISAADGSLIFFFFFFFFFFLYIYIFVPRKYGCESYAFIHINRQSLFSLNDNERKFGLSSARIMLGTYIIFCCNHFIPFKNCSEYNTVNWCFTILIYFYPHKGVSEPRTYVCGLSYHICFGDNLDKTSNKKHILTLKLPITTIVVCFAISLRF